MKHPWPNAGIRNVIFRQKNALRPGNGNDKDRNSAMPQNVGGHTAQECLGDEPLAVGSHDQYISHHFICFFKDFHNWLPFYHLDRSNTVNPGGIVLEFPLHNVIKSFFDLFQDGGFFIFCRSCCEKTVWQWEKVLQHIQDMNFGIVDFSRVQCITENMGRILAEVRCVKDLFDLGYRRQGKTSEPSRTKNIRHEKAAARVPEAFAMSVTSRKALS